MWLYPILTTGIGFVAFAYLTPRCFILARRPGVPTNTKRLTLGLGWLCADLLLGRAQTLAQLAVSRGWLDPSVRSWILTWGISILVLLVLLLGGFALWLLDRVFKDVHRDEQLVSVMITSPVVDVKASD